MRSVVIVMALCAVVSAKPCPKDIETTLVAEYTSHQIEIRPEAGVTVAACTWGKFAGLGWFVEYVSPWSLDSKAEAPPLGGELFITSDGKRAASNFGGGTDHATVRAIDLDGDGIDEAVMQYKWADSMSPRAGENIQVWRVHGTEIERVGDPISVSSSDENGVCTGTAAYSGKRVTITAKGKGCKAKRTYAFVHDAYVEQ